jgi:thiamine biosynthesis lipoprotein
VSGALARAVALGLLAVAAGAPPGERPAARAAGGAAVVERRLAVMGTTLALRLEAADRAAGLAASERAVEAIEAAEARLSTWRRDSELARLNRAPAGAAFPLSPALAADLRDVLAWARATGGAFDPTVGPLVRAWDLRGRGRVPAQGELARAVAATGFGGLELAAGAAVRRRPDIVVEEGGWGKGAALRDALAALDRAPEGGAARALVDLGGQVLVWSARGAGAGWRVDVADPRRRDRPVVALAIDRGSLATSGNSERAIEVGGRRYGHLLDPRTGRPAPDFGSLTVWTADPLAADCLSKLYVMGPERALAWAAAHRGVEVLVLAPEGGGRIAARASRGLAGRLTALVPEVRLQEG